jgi:aspartyl-tRNA(Asn)/glutamyl-tRNA(Gln) amidotransferase subunit A
MDGISGYDERDFSMPDREKPDFSEKADISRLIRRVGVIPEATAMLDESERKAFQDGIRKFSDLGLAVSDLPFKDFDLFPLVHGVIGSVEASSSAGKYDGVRYGHRAQGTKNWNEMYLKSRGESFGLLVKSYLFQGAYFQYENYETFEKACRIRSRLVKDMNDLFSKVGVLVLPTKRLPFDARKAETVQDIYGAFALTLPANVAGLPALQMPGFIAEGAGDIGMQLIGPAFSDAELLALANHLSQQEGMN